MTQDIDKLEQAAREATPGNWVTDYRFGEASMVVMDDEGRLPLATTALYPLAQNNTQRVEANARFISLANPQAILSLVSQVREAETKAARMFEANVMIREQQKEDFARAQAAEAALATLKLELANRAPFTKDEVNRIIAEHVAVIEETEARLATLKREVGEATEVFKRLVAACVEDFGTPDEDDEDDEAVGAGIDSEMAIKFGHICEALRSLALLSGGMEGGSDSTDIAASACGLTATEPQKKSEVAP